MKHLRLLGAALAAIFAVTAIAAVTSAFAENPEIVPSGGFPVTFEGTGTAASLNSKVAIIESKKTDIEGEFTSVREGKLSIDFLEASSSGVPCNSVGDLKGTILVARAGAHLVDILPSSVLSLGIAVTPSTTVLIKCGTVAVEVIGTAIGQVDGVVSGNSIPAKTKKSILFHPTVVGGVTQLFRTCDLDVAFCTGKTYQLLAAFGTGFQQAAQEQPAEVEFNKTVVLNF